MASVSRANAFGSRAACASVVAALSLPRKEKWSLASLSTCSRPGAHQETRLPERLACAEPGDLGRSRAISGDLG